MPARHGPYRRKMKMILNGFERKILRRIFRPVVQQDDTWWVRMNIEPDTLINSEHIVKFIKLQGIRWLGRIYRMEKIRNENPWSLGQEEGQERGGWSVLRRTCLLYTSFSDFYI